MFLLQTNYVPTGGRPELLIVNLEKREGVVSAQDGGTQARRWVLECLAPAHANFVVEGSANLLEWRVMSGQVEQMRPGTYRVIIPEADLSAGFFRLRLTEPLPLQRVASPVQEIPAPPTAEPAVSTPGK